MSHPKHILLVLLLLTLTPRTEAATTLVAVAANFTKPMTEIAAFLGAAATQIKVLQQKPGNAQAFRHVINAEMEWRFRNYIILTMPARYTPGDFTASFDTPVTGPFTSKPSNFFYFEVSLNAFGDGLI